MNRMLWLPVVCFSMYPVLNLYAANVVLIPFRDVLLPLAGAVAFGLLVWLALWSVIREPGRAAGAASIGIVMFFLYGPLQQWAAALSKAGHWNYSGLVVWLVWAGLTIGLCAAGGWLVRKGSQTSTVLAVMGIALVAFTSIQVVDALWRIRAQTRTAVQAGGPAPLADAPDIVMIVLDGYARSDTLERIYGVSNATFIEALASRGFKVAQDARSNYCQTELSLASALNMDYVPALVKPSGRADIDRAGLDALIDDNGVMRRLRRRGYRFIAVTTGFPALKFETADLVFEEDSGRTLFLDALWAKTPIPIPVGRTESQYATRRRQLVGGFEVLERIAPRQVAPRFILAHILAPHPPFVFAADGSPVRPQMPFGLWDGSHFFDVGGTQKAYRKGYADQLAYIGSRTLEAVDALLGAGGRKPIILLMSDHGPKMRFAQDSLARTDVHEAFGTLLAVHAPEPVKDQIPADMTPVNLFRVVLPAITGDELPQLPNRSFYSTWDRPLAFVDVTGQLSHPPSRPR